MEPVPRPCEGIGKLCAGLASVCCVYQVLHRADVWYNALGYLKFEAFLMPATLLSQVPRGDAFFPLPPPADSHSSACWPELLKKLRDAPCITVGTPQQLVEYQTFVYRCIEKVAEGIGADSTWADCNDVLLEPCRRALELVAAGKTSRGRAVAVGLIGLANLSEQLKVATANLPNSGKPGNLTEEPSSSSSSSTSSSGMFKVPALPLKRQRSPNSDELLQQQQQPAAEPQHEAQQQQRRHSAPKRRATPQVWSGGPICITPSAPPNSDMHGETVCDETLLPYWCPISAKRLKADPQPDSPPAAVDSKLSTAGLQEQQPMDDFAMDGAPRVAAEQQTFQQENAGAGVSAAVPRASSSTTRSSSLMQQGSAQASPAVPPSRSAISNARSDAVEALKRNMHEDPASKPSADVLLFNKATQLPIVNWTGPVKHKANGRVVKLCSLTLQVPEAFLEEFPGALYAAEIRHRKSVSLGRHVVCRANLQALSEHQLASLAMMARAQLVAVCMLQTAELHVVPYFDNKNHVRCVGFLKIKAV